MAEHDNAYKHIFSHADMVEGLLRDFVHEDWVGQIDFATLEKVGGSYVTDDIRDREDDIIWRVKYADAWLYVYLLIEFQSSIDPWMALRVMVYTGLLYQDLIKSSLVQNGESLPPVFPLVLYNGKGRWSAVREMAELIVPLPGNLARYRPSQRYFLLDEGRIGETELAQAESLTAELIRLETCAQPEAMRQIIERLISQLKTSRHDSLRRALTVWINRVLLKRLVPGEAIPEVTDLQEINTMLAERVVEWTENWKREGILEGIREGIQQGIQQGRQEGELTLLQKQLERRFGLLSDQTRERIAKATPEQLEAWGLKLLDAASLEEVFNTH